MKLKTSLVLVLVMSCICTSYAQNLLQNSGFETPASNGAVDPNFNDPLPEYWASDNPVLWYKGGNWGNVARTGWRSRSGKWQGAIPGRWGEFKNDNGGFWQHSTNAVRVGKMYTASVWIWADADFSSGNNELKLEFFDAGGGLIHAVTNIFVPKIPSGDSDWSQISVQGVAPADAKEVGIAIAANGLGSNGALQLDDTELYRVLEPPALEITNPSSATAEVVNATNSYTLQGMAQNLEVGGVMHWTNDATGNYGSQVAVSNWTLSAVELDVGVNNITLTTTNEDGVGTATVQILRHAAAPSIYILGPPWGTAVDTFKSTYEVYGICNTNTLDVQWDNGHGVSGVATIYNGTTWTATVDLAHGDNTITVSGTNRTGQVASDTVLISRESDPPDITIYYPDTDISVSNDVVSLSVTGGCFNGASGQISWTNALTGAFGNQVVASLWVVSNISLGVDANHLTFSCSNIAGEVASASVTVTREDELPLIDITSPSTDINVPNATQSYKILGTVNSSVFGLITITNQQSGAASKKVAPPGGGWNFTNIVLREGPNVIMVSASNSTGQTASDTVTIYRDYAKADLWINEIHYVNTNWPDYNEGVEIAGPAGSVLDQYTLYLYGANGMVYNSNRLSGEVDLEVFDSGAVWFPYDNGSGDSISNGPNCGIALAFKDELMEFISYRGTVTGADGPAAGITSVDIGITEGLGTPIWYSLQLQGFGTNSSTMVWEGPYENSYGYLNPGQIISGDRDTNGIPDVWQDIYWTNLYVNPIEDDDDDAFCNLEEFYADTSPIDSNLYPRVGAFQVIFGYPFLRFETSTQRRYIIEACTNMVYGSWTSVGESFMGSGGETYRAVWETGDSGFFRYRVWVPGVE